MDLTMHTAEKTWTINKSLLLNGMVKESIDKEIKLYFSTNLNKDTPDSVVWDTLNAVLSS